MFFTRIALPAVTLCLCAALPAQLPPARDIVVQRNLVYRTVEGTALTLDLFRPAGEDWPLPVVLAFHDDWSAEDGDALRPLAEYLAGMGYAVASVACRPPPRWIFPAQLEDARAASAWVRVHAADCGIDAERCFLLGLSAGGQLAGLLGTQAETARQFAGVILFAAPTDFTVPPSNLQVKIALRIYLGAERDARPDLYAAASPITYVAAGDPPFLVIHGEADEYVPPAQAARLVAALRAKGASATLLTLPGVGHAAPSLTAPAGNLSMRAMLAFLADPRAKISLEK